VCFNCNLSKYAHDLGQNIQKRNKLEKSSSRRALLYKVPAEGALVQGKKKTGIKGMLQVQQKLSSMYGAPETC